jgi:hypothetical protein
MMSAQQGERGIDVSDHLWTGTADWSRQDFSDDNLDAKLKLIEFSYGEVLDATKHQDDKIGRMFMSVAFLTAATLALAGLASASFITRTFHVTPYELPLGLIALTVFLVCMLFAVLQLLVSFATPLRAPGIDQVGRDWKITDWVQGVEASQIYFYPISGVDSHEWMRKWTANAAELKRERFEQLVRETHNLGVRTTFKYDRGAEAVATLSFALLAFGIAIVFVAIAAGSPGTAVIELNLAHRLAIGFILGGYCALQLVARVRYVRQALDEVRPGEFGGPAQYRLTGSRYFVASFSLLITVIAVNDHAWIPYPLWTTLLVTLGFGSLLSSWIATSEGRRRAASDQDSWLRHVVQVWKAKPASSLTGLLLTGAVVASALFFGGKGWYAYQILTAVTAVSLLVGVSLLAPTRAARDRRRRYVNRLRTAYVRVRQDVETPTTAGTNRHRPDSRHHGGDLRLPQQVTDVAGDTDGTGDPDPPPLDAGLVDERA